MGFFRRNKAKTPYDLGGWTAEVMMESGIDVFIGLGGLERATHGEATAQTLKLRPNWDVLPNGNICILGQSVTTLLPASLPNGEAYVTRIQSDTTVGDVIFTVVAAEMVDPNAYPHIPKDVAIKDGLDGAADYLRKHGLVQPDTHK
jgi:hypothetical protein